MKTWHTKCFVRRLGVRRLSSQRMTDGGSTCRPKIVEAMKQCPRNEFAPNIPIRDALADRPLMMEEGFNISAPHMHAMLLEGLDLKPGHRYYRTKIHHCHSRQYRHLTMSTRAAFDHLEFDATAPNVMYQSLPCGSAECKGRFTYQAFLLIIEA